MSRSSWGEDEKSVDCERSRFLRLYPFLFLRTFGFAAVSSRHGDEIDLEVLGCGSLRRKWETVFRFFRYVILFSYWF